jgi:hypothetical protein
MTGDTPRPRVSVVHDGTTHWLAPGDQLVFGRGRECQIRVAHDQQDTQVSRRAGTLSLLPHPVFDVVLLGAYGHRYGLAVDARAVTPPEPAPDDDPELLPAAGRRTRATLPAGTEEGFPPAQLRVLAALCEPLRAGGAQPATYRQVGERLGLSPGYVRNVLKAVRETLDGRGVPGMVIEDDPDSGADLRTALALWALRSGVLDAAGRSPDDPREAGE